MNIHKRIGRKGGFSLAELMVVMSIVVLLAAMSLPSLAGHMKQRRLKSAARMMQMVFMEARSRAISQREVQHVVFFVNNTSYDLWDGNDTNAKDRQSGGSNVVKQGVVGTIYSYQSNTSSVDPGSGANPLRYIKVGEELTIPEFVNYYQISGLPATPPVPSSGNSYNFQCNFFPDGKMTVRTSCSTTYGTSTLGVTQTDGTLKIIEFSQPNQNDLRCIIKVVPASSQVLFSIQ